MAEMEPRAQFVPWSTDAEPPASSLPAQVVAKIVAASYPELAAAHRDRLFRAYFVENRTISDWDVLIECSADVGVDVGELRTLLAEQRTSVAQQVIDEHNDAIGQGITAVPTVLINGILPVPGAQDSATYINWIERILERS